jgi:predicted TIM-barrel fold metal-dependent hydrolase
LLVLTRREFLAAGLAFASPEVAGVPYSPVIDSHVHVWGHEPAYPFAPGAIVPEIDASPAALLRLMKENHVSKTVLIQVIHYKWTTDIWWIRYAAPRRHLWAYAVSTLKIRRHLTI